MAGAPSATDSELELHFAAYDEIFRAALAKLPLDDTGRAARLEKARRFLRENVQHTDDFISQIAGLARELGVKEAALGTFIGANFLKALQMVRKRASDVGQRSAPGAAPGASGSGGPAGAPTKKFTSILQEIAERFGPIVAGGQFVPLEDGLLKFVGPAGEVLPASMGAEGSGGSGADGSGAASGSASGAGGAAPQPGVSASAEPPAGARPAAKPSAPPAPRVPEKSIIKEILERLGSVLDVPGKLVPSTGIEGGGGVDSDEDDEESDNLSEDQEASAGDDSPGAAVASKTISSARAATAPPEQSIISEILSKLGSHLDVHQKLEPSSGIEPGDYDDSDDHESDDEGEQEAGAPADKDRAVPAPLFQALPLDFEGYMGTLRRVQEFQAGGRDAEYRHWLSAEASAPQKALVGLRNLEARAKGTAVDWDAQYESLSAHMDGISPEHLSNLHQRIRGFAQIHQLVGRVKGGLQGKPQPLVNAMRVIWPNLLLLLNEDTDLGGYQAEFRIALLAVPDPATRTQVETFLRPVFEKLAGIYESMKM